MPVQITLQSPHIHIACNRNPNAATYTLIIDDQANQTIIHDVPESQLKAIAYGMVNALPNNHSIRTPALNWLGGLSG